MPGSDGDPGEEAFPSVPLGPGGQLPAGTANQHLRNNGGSWVASSVLQDNGTNVTDTGNFTAQGATHTFGTAGTATTVTVGQGTTGADAGACRVRSGNSGSTRPSFFLNRNGTDVVEFTTDGTNTALAFVGTLNLYPGVGAGSSVLGISQAGIISQYKSVSGAASENGVPFTTVSASGTGKTANITATNLVVSAVAGRYRMCCALNVTTAASVSSTIPDCNLITTDPTDSVAKTAAVVTGNLFPAVTNPGTGVGITGCGIANVKTGTAIQYSTSNYASNVAGMTYDLYVTLETM